jgi:cysteinyl-tRNA synthetase
VRTVRLHDTLSGDLRALEPRTPGRVGIYACGPTVYDRVHVGNARPFVLFALLKRFLEREGFEVTLVENITDVNDKIYAAAREAGRPSADLAREMTEHYVEDTSRLDLGRPDAEPRATDAVPDIIDLIEALIDRGHAYVAAGDVYFRVRSHAAYGKLSNRDVDEMIQGEDDDLARGGLKKSPLDFALWKASKPGEDTSWEAPWGAGRPGWHIECSAMAERILGLDFEIHGGGSDLVFPHHENEVAQTEAARGAPLARLWMHNGMIRFEDEKMSKSVGNIRSLHGALDEYGRDALVMYLVSGHYRQPLGFSADALAEAARSVERVRDLVRRLDLGAMAPEGGDPHVERFFDALAEDFNTAAARAVLFEWVGDANRRLDAGQAVAARELKDMLWGLGLEGLLEPAETPGTGDPAAVRLLEEREAARAARDFATADARRDELARIGWEVRDTPQGPRLVPARRAEPPAEAPAGR